MFTPILLGFDDTHDTRETFTGNAATVRPYFGVAFDNSKCAFVGSWAGYEGSVSQDVTLAGSTNLAVQYGYVSPTIVDGIPLSFGHIQLVKGTQNPSTLVYSGCAWRQAFTAWSLPSGASVTSITIQFDWSNPTPATLGYAVGNFYTENGTQFGGTTFTGTNTGNMAFAGGTAGASGTFVQTVDSRDWSGLLSVLANGQLGLSVAPSEPGRADGIIVGNVKLTVNYNSNYAQGLRCSVWDGSSGKPALVGTATWTLPMPQVTSTQFRLQVGQRADDTHIVILYEASDQPGPFQMFAIPIELQNGTKPVFGSPVEWMPQSDYLPSGSSNPTIVNDTYLLAHTSDGHLMAGVMTEYSDASLNYFQQISTRELIVSGDAITLGAANSTFNETVTSARASKAAFPSFFGSATHANGNVTAYGYGQDQSGNTTYLAWTFGPTGTQVARTQVWDTATNSTADSYDYIRITNDKAQNVVRIMVQAYVNPTGGTDNGFLVQDINPDGTVAGTFAYLQDPHWNGSWNSNDYGDDPSAYFHGSPNPTSSGGIVNMVLNNSKDASTQLAVVGVLYRAASQGALSLVESGQVQVTTANNLYWDSIAVVSPNGQYLMVWSPTTSIFPGNYGPLTVTWWQVDVADAGLTGYLGDTVRYFQV